MKIKYLKLKNWLLVSAMSLFGLSACHCHKDVAKQEENNKPEKPRFEDRVVPMYGVQVRDYRVEALDDGSKPQVDPANPKTQPQPREPQVTVYGVPTVDFAVKGRVVDGKGKPVKGLQVMLLNSEVDYENLPDTPHWKEQLKKVSDTTDADGRFEVRTSDRPWETVRVMVRDIDGAKNGTYEQQLVDVDFGEPKPVGNRPISSWNLGEKQAEVTVKVNKK
ncbi:MAG: radical SAM-associated putative lipoprotein [Bacteroidales bacterium]|nr:radical SAM-associated putative lipoprotein [Bacteroidales bacterium]